jgi:hypothetical protein
VTPPARKHRTADRVAARMDGLRLRPVQAARAQRRENDPTPTLVRSGDVELQRRRLAGGMPGAPGPPHCDSVGGRRRDGRTFSRLVLGGRTSSAARPTSSRSRLRRKPRGGLPPMTVKTPVTCG